MSSSPPSVPEEPSSPGVGSAGNAQATKTRKQRRMRRKLAGGLVLLMALVGAGFAATALTPHAQVATADEDQSSLIRQGKQLYDTSCITCHGANLQGVQDRGPSLIGVGSAAVYFQVSTGRMPAPWNAAQIVRKPPKFDESQTDALMAYIASNGGGPSVVRDADGKIAQESLIKGADLGVGGAQNMPKFSDRQLTPDEKRDIIAYIKNRTESHPEGGYGLGGFGPATEGLAMWVIGIVAVVGAAMWIG